MENILKEIRVLDFTRVLAGPYATRILADFGAEVIKVQSKKIATGAESNTSDYFSFWNRNKRSITLNMSHPKGRELLSELVEICDVLIENFSPRVMSNWGLNYDKLKRINSDLIMLRMSAMGQTGPWKNYTAFGPTIQSLSGVTYLTADDESTPMGPGNSYADIVSGLYGAIAIMSALNYRDQTGCGQYIDLSEYEAMVSMMGPHLLDASVNLKSITPAGNPADHIQAAPYGCYPCQGEDRWCVIAVCNEDEWQGLCDILGNPSWTKKIHYASPLKRKENAKKLNEHLEAWTINQTAEDIVQLLQEAGIPAGVVQNAEELANDPQLAARNFFSNRQSAAQDRIAFDNYPFKFQGAQPIMKKPAPTLGEDNEYVYKSLLGLSEKKYLSYVNKGIIG